MDHPLVLSDLFEYDFSACAYKILESIGIDLNDVNFDNKEERNIQLGLLQRRNPRIGILLSDSIKNLIDFYINQNGLSEEDIILRQRDGIITKRKLEIIDKTMPLELRNIISKLIFSISRKQWLIIYQGGDVVVKGIRDKPLDISFYNLFKNIDYSNKGRMVDGLENIRLVILSSNNVLWFTKKDEKDNYLIPILGMGILKLRKSSLGSVELKEIDRQFLWNDYVWPFVQSLLIHSIP